MALDLSALEEKPAASKAPAVVVSEGKPLEIKLTDIEEDPDQPRKEFDQVALAELADSIKETGVRTPISVRKHPTQSGKWIINYGARRYRASQLIGKATIPAFVDESHDNYDQVIENLQRDNLTAMEMALFIQKRLAVGDSKAEIARKLGKSKSAISEYSSLIDAPDCILAAYNSGKCTSAKTLYDLRMIYKDFPVEVEAWCEDAEEITRTTVTQLAARLKNPPPPPAAELDIPSIEDAALDVDDATDEGSDTSPVVEKSNQSGDKAADKSNGVNVAGMDSFAKKADKDIDPDIIAKPLLVVEYDGRTAAVLLNLRPSIDGFLHIKFDDNSEETEVDASDCKILMLTSK